MRNIFLIMLFFSTLSFAIAQDKEWRAIITLLNDEAQYFKNKQGYIQLGTSEYNTFSIQQFMVNDTMVHFSMLLKDRFQNTNTTQLLEDYILLLPEMKITAASINYNYAYYFEDFPQTQFLLLEFEEEYPMIHKINSVYTDIKTEQTDSYVIEETTYQIYFPIRTQSRKKIFAAINQYQTQTLKNDLKNDRYH